MEKEGQGEFYITSYISTSIVYMYQITNHYIDFYRKQITDTTNLSILEVNTYTTLLLMSTSIPHT